MNNYSLKKEFYASLAVIKKISGQSSHNNGKFKKAIAAEQATIHTRTIVEGYRILEQQKTLIKKIFKGPYQEVLRMIPEISSVFSESQKISKKLKYLLTSLDVRISQHVGARRKMAYAASQLDAGVKKIISSMGNHLSILSNLVAGARTPEDKLTAQRAYDQLNAQIKEFESKITSSSQATAPEATEQDLEQLRVDTEHLSQVQPAKFDGHSPAAQESIRWMLDHANDPRKYPNLEDIDPLFGRPHTMMQSSQGTEPKK